MKSEYKTISKTQYPKWVKSLSESKKLPEEYLSSFASWCVKYAVGNGVGDIKHLGEKFSVHISDTRGRKTIANTQGSAVGLCYSVEYSANKKVRRIEIDRETSDTLKALEIIAHEVSHAVTKEGIGHNGEFVHAVFGLFKLGGIPTSTSVTLEFTELIKPWLQKAGTYPYVKFVDRRKVQTTRMVKLVCKDFNCFGSTEKSRKQGQGTIFRLSSAIVEKVQDIGEQFYCPVCNNYAYVDGDVETAIYK